MSGYKPWFKIHPSSPRCIGAVTTYSPAISTSLPDALQLPASGAAPAQLLGVMCWRYPGESKGDQTKGRWRGVYGKQLNVIMHPCSLLHAGWRVALVIPYQVSGEIL